MTLIILNSTTLEKGTVMNPLSRKPNIHTADIGMSKFFSSWHTFLGGGGGDFFEGRGV